MLLDTSGLLSLHYKTEPFHTQALVGYQKATVRLTHSYVIAEYVALANARRFGVAEKRDELKRSFKHPAHFHPQIQQRRLYSLAAMRIVMQNGEWGMG